MSASKRGGVQDLKRTLHRVQTLMCYLQMMLVMDGVDGMSSGDRGGVANHL